MASPSSSDEGEIVESRGGNLKATSLRQFDGHGVDRIDRTRARISRSRSPENANGYSQQRSDASRRSRSPRGLKRPHDDRYRDRDAHRGGRLDPDPRRFQVHYEDSRDSYRRGARLPYDDEDRPSSRSSTANLSYDDKDRDYARDRPMDRSQDRNCYSDKRPRNRTRSPYSSTRGAGRGQDRDRDRGEYARRDIDQGRRNANRNGNEFVRSSHHQNSPRHVRDFPDTSKQSSTVKETGTALSNGDTAAKDNTSKAPEPENGVEEETPVDIEAEIERRRRRRQEILAKTTRATPTSMLVQALQTSTSEKANGLSPTTATRGSTPVATEANTPQSAVSSPRSPNGLSLAPLDLANDRELINTHGNQRNGDDEDGPSAADYDPTADMMEDELRDERRHGHVGPHGEILHPEEKAEIPPVHEEQNSKKPTADDDDDFDMFAEDFDEDKFVAPKTAKFDATADDRKDPAALALPNGGGILEGDDKDGYYKIRIGEIMNGRYQVQSTLGKGMFSGVVRAVDITNKKLVAIKMMRNNDALRKGGFTEIAILQKINDADPENRKHIVKFDRHFEHKSHLCLAFENLSLNLREVLKKFGNNIGINLSATRAYAHQIFVALAHLRKCSIVHADLKPDNILVNETRNVLKLCDLDHSRMPYDYAIDMWSIGCTLYELYTGKILFAGDSNNQMLKAIMEIRGKFSPKLFKRGELSHQHFDELGNFVSVEQDKTLGKTTARTLTIVKPTRDLRTRLLAVSGGMTDTESRDLNHFIDLLERCLALNPDKRITPSEALKHPFFLSRGALR
ncbi:kinase-like domain-containing protein [Astrocystis sublimbata]|nr:kinase-like domain-containing protein [Astrocystis sublimbata]